MRKGDKIYNTDVAEKYCAKYELCISPKLLFVNVEMFVGAYYACQERS
jgi:hypothetical protein